MLIHANVMLFPQVLMNEVEMYEDHFLAELLEPSETF